MTKTLLAGCILTAFFVRDIRLLVAAGRSRIAPACAAYAVLFVLYTAAVGEWLSLVHTQMPNLITIDVRIWVGIVAVHIVLCGLTWQMSRVRIVRGVWVVALVPSPAVLLSLCFAAGALPENIGVSLGLLSPLLFS